MSRTLMSAEEREAPSKRHEITPPTRTKPENKSRCGGVWIGVLNFGILGNADETVTIDPSGTVVVEKNQFGSATHPATWDGTTVRFQSGALNEIAFTLAPNADGQTAVVTATSLFMSNPGAAFRKIGNYEASTGVATSASTMGEASQQPTEIPRAKPVPGRPGFVYNPFDPTAARLLLMTTKSFGSRVKSDLRKVCSFVRKAQPVSPLSNHSGPPVKSLPASA